MARTRNGSCLRRLGQADLRGDHPQSLGTAYVNFMPDDEPARVEGIYGNSYRRLAEIKLRYDPANMFRMNQNIRPAAL